MKKIKVFHEAPLCLMNHVREETDGDYCLPHLLDSNEGYKKFFYESKEKERCILMDNSLHELGHAYDKDRLLFWINELKPNAFFVPDVWGKCTDSIVNAREWAKIEFPEGVDKIAIVQANNLTETVTCVQTYLDLGYKRLAFTYGLPYYDTLNFHPDKDIRKALGRVQVISWLYDKNVINKYHRIHLLGTSCPFEFSLYKDIECIHSIDTSNPVMTALEGIHYNHLGIHSKPKLNMNNCFDVPIEKVNMGILNYNIKAFRNIVKY